MSKKILYINFNIVMHPYFNTYAHHIQDNNLSPDAVWDKLNKELNLYEYVQYDPETLMNVANLLVRFANKKNFQNSTLAPQEFSNEISSEDEIVYIDFENSFKTVNCASKTWIGSAHSDMTTSNNTHCYLLDNLTQFFETKHKFDEVYFYFPQKQVPYKFYHLYQLLKKYGTRR